MMEDAERRGYMTPEEGKSFLCAQHLTNKYLKQFINDKGHSGTCSYCSKTGIVLDLAVFIDHIGDRMLNFVGPIENESLPLATSFYDDDEEVIPGFERRGLFIAPNNAEYYEDVHEVMEDFDLVSSNERLNQDIASCFFVNQWIRRDPTELLLNEELFYLWNDFSEMVKKRCRFTFFRNKEYFSDKYGYKYGSDIIADVSSLVTLTEDTIYPGTYLFRGRPDGSDAPYTTFKSLSAPPITSAKANRMSPYGISMFYGSFEASTPVAEINNYMEDKTKVYVGKFRVMRPLIVINFCNMPYPNFWMNGKDEWQKYAFLHQFHDEISKPIGKNDSDIEYIPSQVFTEYLRYIQKTKDGSKYDGIIYRSAITKRDNIVLFYDNNTSNEILELVSSEISSE